MQLSQTVIYVIFVERREGGGCLLDDLSMIRTDSCTWHRKHTDGISSDNCMSQSWLDLKSSKKVVAPVFPRFVNYFGRGSPRCRTDLHVIGSG